MNKIKSYLINSLLIAGFIPTAEAISAPHDVKLDAPEKNKSWISQRERGFTLAGHKSHSSHGSHGSHRSSSGGRSSPKYTPSYPKYTPPTVKNYKKEKSAKSDSTAPSSILPLSPATSPKVTKIKGNSKAFKVLVMQVQIQLFSLGMYSGEIDGISGPKTSTAISKYELNKGLPVTGRLSDELLDYLNINSTDILNTTK